MDIEQEVTGADGRTYGVGSTEILTDAQKDEIGQTIGGMSEEAIPAEQNMGLDSMSNMPMMSEEEKRVFKMTRRRKQQQKECNTKHVTSI